MRNFYLLIASLICVETALSYSPPFFWNFSSKEILPENSFFLKGELSLEGKLKVFKDQAFQTAVSCQFPKGHAVAPTSEISWKKINLSLDCGIEVFGVTQYDMSPMKIYLIGLKEVEDFEPG